MDVVIGILGYVKLTLPCHGHLDTLHRLPIKQLQSFMLTIRTKEMGDCGVQAINFEKSVKQSSTCSNVVEGSRYLFVLTVEIKDPIT